MAITSALRTRRLRERELPICRSLQAPTTDRLANGDNPNGSVATHAAADVARVFFSLASLTRQDAVHLLRAAPQAAVFTTTDIYLLKAANQALVICVPDVAKAPPVLVLD